MKYFAGLFIFICCFCSRLQGQKNGQNLITATFHEAGIREMTEEIESQTDYFFYYDIAIFDTLRVTFSVSREPLTAVLDKAFANTSLVYSIGPHNEVYLTKGTGIQTNLETNPQTSGKARRNVYLSDEDINANAGSQKATMEIKLYQIGASSSNNGQANALISGYVRDAKTGESIGGCFNIY